MALHRQPKKEPPAIVIAVVALVSTLALVVALGIFVIDPLIPKSKQTHPTVNPPSIAKETPTDYELEQISNTPSPAPSTRPSPTTVKAGTSKPTEVTRNAQPVQPEPAQPRPIQPEPFLPVPNNPVQPVVPQPLPQLPPANPIVPPRVTVPALPNIPATPITPAIPLPAVTIPPIKLPAIPIRPLPGLVPAVTQPVKDVVGDVTKNAPTVPEVTDPIVGLIP